MRVQIVRVRIGGAWDGISSNNHNAVVWLDDIEMGALDCGLSLGEGTGILDACHINGYHFWNFDLTYAGQVAVMSDGQSIAARFGEVDGLDAKGFGALWGRVVFTAAAGNGWYAFTNLALDTSATLEVAAVKWLHITNLYLTAGPGLLRPLIEVDGGSVQIANLYATGSQPQRLLSVRGGDVTVTSFALVPYNTTVNAVFVDAGFLRLLGGHVYPGTGAAYAAALIEQAGTGSLQITNLDCNGLAGSSGTAVKFDTDNAPNLLGATLLAAGWTVGLPATTANGVYVPFTATLGGVINGPVTFNGGSNWGDQVGANNFDMTKHIQLHTAGYGFSVTGGRLNYIAAGGAMHAMISNGVDVLRASNSAIALPQIPGSTTYANDAAAATGGVAVGQLYRSGSAIMLRVT
jgi:hypothetical protein